MARRSGWKKWGVLGSVLAGVAVFIPLVPAMKRRAMRATTILKKDHRMVAALIATLQVTPKVNGMLRKALFEQIRSNLMIHSQVEEEILYPALRSYAASYGESKVDDAYRDHQQIKDFLSDLGSRDPLSESFEMRLQELKSAIERHVDEEENQLFRALTEGMPTERQEELGQQIHERKIHLKTQRAA